MDRPLTMEYDLLYVGIGVASSAIQQYPPPVASWPGKKVCLLIDPIMETHPAICTQLGVDCSDHTITVNDTTFIFVRDYFHWTNAAYVMSLIDHTLSRNAHMIVQDYTGEYFRRHYPIEIYDRDILLRHVLFDMTYRDVGCCVDFSQVRIFRDMNGDFVQPAYMQLSSAQAYLSPIQLFNEAAERYHAVIDFAHYMVRIENGYETARDWCTYESVFEKTQRLFYIYKLDPSVDMLRGLILETVMDIVATTGSYVDPMTVFDLINSSKSRELAQFCRTYLNRIENGDRQ